MQSYRFSSGLRAGAGGFIATVIFLAFSVVVFRDVFDVGDFQSAPKGWFILAWITMATIPTIAAIPAVLKSVYVLRSEEDIEIIERGIFGTKRFQIRKGTPIKVKLEIFAFPNSQSCIRLTGDTNAKIGKGLRDAELRALHSEITT